MLWTITLKRYFARVFLAFACYGYVDFLYPSSADNNLAFKVEDALYVSYVTNIARPTLVVWCTTPPGPATHVFGKWKCWKRFETSSFIRDQGRLRAPQPLAYTGATNGSRAVRFAELSYAPNDPSLIYHVMIANPKSDEQGNKNVIGVAVKLNQCPNSNSVECNHCPR